MRLPPELLDELGVEDATLTKGRSRGPTQRKESRKTARIEKKRKTHPSQFVAKSSLLHSRRPTPRQEPPASDDNVGDGDFDGFSDASAKETVTKTPPKSILKTSASSSGKGSRGLSFDDAHNPKRVRSLSKAVQDALAEDGAEVARLEKKLGMKGKKKLPQSFKDDGLDEILGDTEELENEDAGRKTNWDDEDDEWLKRKRRTAIGGTIEEDSAESDSDVQVKVNGTNDGQRTDSDKDEEAATVSESYEKSSSDSAKMGRLNGTSQNGRVRENPYRPPITSPNQGASVQKYIPPSLRNPSRSDAQLAERLRRQLQGLLNKLSTENLLSILSDLEQLYRSNARQLITESLIELLFGLLCDETALQDTFIILYAGFITAIYRVIGADFGVQIVQRLVELLGDQSKREVDEDPSNKKSLNLISLLSNLHIFQMISSVLVCDYVRLFLDNLNEHTAELLLKIVRLSGPQLRQDDPSSLKDIVLLLHPAVAKLGANVSVRTKFMVESITDLKNNRMKTGAAASSINSEHIVRMKKILGSMNNRVTRAGEPLRMTLKDIKESDKRGKWWLVGASYRDDLPASSNAELEDAVRSTSPNTDMLSTANDATNLDALAKAHRMNTNVRRSIFTTILSASDYRDAHTRILKLRLKRAQEPEIPRVLLHCAGGEASYNPYYTMVARQLCTEKRMRMAFQFALWDLLKRMGEGIDAEDGEDDDEVENQIERLGMRNVVNLAKMFAALVAAGSLPLSILKVLNLLYLKSRVRAFVEILLVTMFVDLEREYGRLKGKARLEVIFAETASAPDLLTGLQWFLRNAVKESDLVSDIEKAIVGWAMKIASDTLISRAHKGK